MTRRFFTFFSYMLITTFITIGFTSCSKDDDFAPEVPKTEEQIQTELKEELRTTMKFNSNYKTLLYSSLLNPGFKSAADFNKSLVSAENNFEQTKYMAPTLVINKKANLFFSTAGVFYFYEKFTLEKNGDIITIKAKHDDAWQVSSDGKFSKSSTVAFSLNATYNLKTGESLRILEAWMNDAIFMVMANEWVQDKSITKASKTPADTVDPNEYINF